MDDEVRPLLSSSSKQRPGRRVVPWLATLAIVCGGVIRWRQPRDEPMLARRLSRRLRSIKLDGVACNDGSAVSYYYSPGWSKAWVVYFQGGGWCYKANCSVVGSSTNWTDSIDLMDGSLFSAWTGPLAGASVVWASYCSQDAWVGNTSNFQGANIVSALLDDLEPKGLASASLAVVAGGSAGGRGVVYNYERLRQRIRGRLILLVDSAVWLRSPCTDRHIEGFEALRNPIRDELLTSQLLPAIDTPLVVFEFLYDAVGIARDSGYASSPSAEFAERWRRNMSDYLGGLPQLRAEPTLVYAPACYAHDPLGRGVLSAFRVNGVDFQSALDDFIREPSASSRVYVDTCRTGANCGDSCSWFSKVEVPWLTQE